MCTQVLPAKAIYLQYVGYLLPLLNSTGKGFFTQKCLGIWSDMKLDNELTWSWSLATHDVANLLSTSDGTPWFPYSEPWRVQEVQEAASQWSDRFIWCHTFGRRPQRFLHYWFSCSGFSLITLHLIWTVGNLIRGRWYSSWFYGFCFWRWDTGRRCCWWNALQRAFFLDKPFTRILAALRQKTAFVCLSCSRVTSSEEISWKILFVSITLSCIYSVEKSTLNYNVNEIWSESTWRSCINTYIYKFMNWNMIAKREAEEWGLMEPGINHQYNKKRYLT